MHEFQFKKLEGVGDAFPCRKKWGTPSPASPAPLHLCTQRAPSGKLPPLWVDVEKLCNRAYVCVFIVMELLRITRQIHCKAVERRATLIQRQYNRDWGTSYSRPPIDPYMIPHSPPCYKILAAPLQPHRSSSAGTHDGPSSRAVMCAGRDMLSLS